MRGEKFDANVGALACYPTHLQISTSTSLRTASIRRRNVAPRSPQQRPKVRSTRNHVPSVLCVFHLSNRYHPIRQPSFSCAGSYYLLAKQHARKAAMKGGKVKRPDAPTVLVKASPASRARAKTEDSGERSAQSNDFNPPASIQG